MAGVPVGYKYGNYLRKSGENLNNPLPRDLEGGKGKAEYMEPREFDYGFAAYEVGKDMMMLKILNRLYDMHSFHRYEVGGTEGAAVCAAINIVLTEIEKHLGI